MRHPIGLRHDVDTVIGLRRGVKRLIVVEDRLDARSSFYVRARLLDGRGEACRLLRRLEYEGWEIGLHLDDADLSLGTAFKEYLALSSCGVRVRGLTIHGGLIGCRGWATWRIASMMGVEYLHGCPGQLSATPVVLEAPTIGFDHLIAVHGEEGAVREAARLACRAAYRGGAVILAHPVYTVVSASARLTLSPRRRGLRVRLAKAAEKLLAGLYTLAGRGLTLEPYSRLLRLLGEEGFSLVPLHSLLRG